MELNNYQARAMETCMASCHNFSYMMLNLVGEVGELASKVAKSIRKGEVSINDNVLESPLRLHTPSEREALLGEAGDILWQLAGLCHTLGFSLEDVAQYNLAKLASRRERGVIDGDGDNR